MKLFILSLSLFSALAYSMPVVQYSEDGEYFRLYNPEDRYYYCIIVVGNNYPFEKLINAGYTTRWYPTRYGFNWECN
jgi:hypothetical protein